MKMLRNLVECKLQADFLIIEDTEEVGGQDLFSALLKNCESDNSVKQINLICYENLPAFYTPDKEFKNGKIVEYNFLCDACQWDDSSVLGWNLKSFTSDPKSLAETAFFIDSLSFLAYHTQFFSMCRDLNFLKRFSKKIVCVVHSDLFSLEQLEEIYFLSSACLKVQKSSLKEKSNEKICELTFKKPGGKIIKQKEFFSVNHDLRVTCMIPETKDSVLSDPKKDMESLTTFKLGLQISEEERKAKSELVLPYMKSATLNKTSEIIYQPEPGEWEDDPDDDLDI